MVKTLDDIAVLLNKLKTEAGKNAKNFTKLLSSMSTKLEALSEDNDENTKSQIEELKTLIETKHNFIETEFEKVENSFESITEEQSLLAKTTEMEDSFSNFSEHINSIATELANQKEIFSEYNENFKKFAKDKTIKKDIIKSVTEIKKDVESANKRFEKSIGDINSNIQSILQNLIVMDPTAQNDIVKRELENIYLSTNSILTELNNSDTGALNEKFEELKNLISQNVKLRDDKFLALEEKIDEYNSNINKISNETNIKIGNSISEITGLKKDISYISKQFANLNCNDNKEITNITDSITSDLDKINSSVSNINNSTQAEISRDLTESTENIERQINNLIELIEEIKNQDNNEAIAPLKEIKDKITAIKQEINLVNTDIIDAVNSKTDLILGELIPIKEAISNINCAPINITTDDNTPLSSDVQTIISAIQQIIDQKLSSYNFNADNKVFELLDLINTKVDGLANNSGDEILTEIDEVKTMIVNQKNFIKNSDDNVKIQEIQTNLEDLVNKIDALDNNANLADVRESIITAIISVFEQISFLEETEEIKDFVEEKTDALSQSITEVKQQLKQLTNNDNDDYAYTLQDIETDIAKLRIVLNEISASSTNEEISDISSNINKIVSSVEELQSSLTQEQITELKTNLEKLSEDVISISSRTNKLLLSSDESYQSLTNSMSDFSNIITQLEERINYSDNKETTERIENKLDNAISIISENTNTNKVLKQALGYVGEWIDTASENFNHIQEQTNEQKKLIDTLTEKFDEQQERMDRLEKILEKILFAIDDIDNNKITKKVDKIEKQIAKLSTSVEKLTSYVD